MSSSRSAEGAIHARPSRTHRPRKVFITGANGFIGKALTARLRELGAEVTGVDLVGDPANGIVEGTTSDPDVWKDALDGVDAVVHTAAIVSTVAPIDKAWEVNVLGTRKVLDAAIAAGVSRFVHLSSVAAYGFDFPDERRRDLPRASLRWPEQLHRHEGQLRAGRPGRPRGRRDRVRRRAPVRRLRPGLGVDPRADRPGQVRADDPAERRQGHLRHRLHRQLRRRHGAGAVLRRCGGADLQHR